MKQELLSDEWFIAHGFEIINDDWHEVYRYTYTYQDNYPMSIILEYNPYDETWIYKDFRNALYGLRTANELYTLLKFLNINITIKPNKNEQTDK